MGRFAQIDSADYSGVAPLLASLAPLHGSVPAVLAGASEGRVWVDDVSAPRAVLLAGPEGLYLGGAPHDELDWSALRASIHPLAYLYPADAWLPVIDKVLPHSAMLRHQRITLVRDLDRPAQSVMGPSDRFVVRPMAGEVGAEVVDGDAVIAHCHEDMVVGDRVEVGVWTDPRYRRLGLARLAVGGAIAVARERGLKRMGWHCLASNAGSLTTALRSGFSVAAEYVAYGACLPAENRGDLDAAQWLELAAHFEQGAVQHPLLRIYAAEALSAAGQSDAALATLEQLVETPWNGRADWIESSWALAPLDGDPRFSRALARQRELEGRL